MPIVLPDDDRQARMAALHGGVAMDLVLKLRGERLRQGLSQRELAGRVGASAHAVQDWETGDDLPATHHAFGWALAMRLQLALANRGGVLIRRSAERAQGESHDRFEMRRAGLILRDERISLMMTQKDVAALTGLTDASISRGEKRGPGWLSDLLKWAAAVECMVLLVNRSGHRVR